VAFLAALAFPVLAQSELNVATITQAVYVRSGPSDSFYPTARLNPGDKVTLADEKQYPWLEKKRPPPGWLAIKPPDKSFSWVNKRFLKVEGRTAFVTEETTANIGSAEYDQFPNVKQVKLKPGDILVIVGEEKTAPEGGIWVMVAPPPQEVRYIPAQAIQTNPAATAAATTPAATPPPAKAPGADTWNPPASSSAPAAADNQLWAQADKAQQEGRREEAERLYSQLANQTTDANMRIWALNRLEFLRKNAASVVTTGTQPPAPLNPQTVANNTAVPNYPYGPTVSAPPLAQGRVTSQYAYDRDRPPNANTPIASPKSVEQWTDVGELRKSYLQVDGNKVYALEMNNGQRFLYVTAYPGLNLDQYVNRKIVLFGPILYSGSLRNYYMSATHLRMAQ
jgi:hypothetical protein